MTLPTHASETSRKRYELAVRLAESCPPELGGEVALTGSTSAGLADDESDLELNLWSEAIPPAEARVAWLRAAGVEDIQVFEQPRPDESYWIGGSMGDVPLEVGWQTFDVSGRNIEKILSGSMSQVMAYILVNAIPLRTGGRLVAWQARLRAYSDVVQAQIVQQALERWSETDHIEAALRLARRGEGLAVMEHVLNDLRAVVSLLYALNRRWQPSRKWTLSAARDLPLAPERWRERLGDALTAPPEMGVRLCAALARDVLVLVPTQYDVSKAVTALQVRLSRKE